MGAPRQCSGVQAVPKAGQSTGFLTPCRTSPAMQTAASSEGGLSTAKRLRGVEAGIGAFQPQSAGGDDADAPPLVVDDLEHLLDEGLRLGVALPLDRAGVLVLDLVASRLELLDEHVDPLEEVERLEAGDDDGDMILRRQRLVLSVAGDGADVPRRQEALHAVVGRGGDRLHGGGDQDMGG